VPPPRVLVLGLYDHVLSARPEAEIFLALHRSGIPVDVMTRDGSEYARRFRQAGMTVVDWLPPEGVRLSAIRRIRAELVRGGHRVLFLMNNRAIKNGVWAAIGLPVKVVAYRGVVGNVSALDPTGYLKVLHPRVDRVLCNSDGVRDSVRAGLPGRREKAITILKNHDLAWYGGVRPLDRASLGVPPDAFAVAGLANIRPMKGLRYLLEATRLLPTPSPIHLVLMGQGLEHPRWRPLLESSPIRRQIHLLGYRADPLPVVAACDALVLPSISGEGMPKAVIEAMALGVPPIMTDLPGPRGLVVDGESGRVVPPRDAAALAAALDDLASDRARARRLGAAARARIGTRFRHEDTARAVRALVDELAAEP
jgi:glycosyltransferase involved in cell wall biosynthesis